MPDLSALIPPHEPAEDTLATVGGMALDAIPLIGPVAGRVLDLALATRERERRNEFDTAIVGALQRLAQRADETLTVADVVNSDEFLATLARTRRAAAETASTSKRQRLARAAVSALDPNAPSRAERESNLRLITELDDLHIWLLAYFADPRAWLDHHGLLSTYKNVASGNADGPLKHALSSLGIPLSGSVEAALSDLERLDLANVSPRVLRPTVTADAMFQSRVSTRGRAFLAYLDEGNPAEADPPAASPI
ncbi:hypothetical protein ACTU6U_06095 [Microbacterium sp. A196]|uniref:hypothetical protein n=1 Tax=Microbacterium sp. A196 TaxID=3457320 RepID=UPI003FD28BCB